MQVVYLSLAGHDVPAISAVLQQCARCQLCTASELSPKAVSSKWRPSADKTLPNPPTAPTGQAGVASRSRKPKVHHECFDESPSRRAVRPPRHAITIPIPIAIAITIPRPANGALPRHKSIIAYLAANNLPTAAAALRSELNLQEDEFDAATAKKYENLLERKWTSIVRLQKKACAGPFRLPTPLAGNA
jgi:hypothetical protein